MAIDSDFFASLRKLSQRDVGEATDPFEQIWTVRAACDAIYSLVMGVPFRAVTGDEGETQLPEGHPLALLLDRPNPFQTGSELAASWAVYLRLDGFAAAILYADGSTLWDPTSKRMPREVLTIDPRKIAVDDYDRSSGIVTRYRVTVADTQVVVPAASIVMVRSFNPRDLQRGSSALNPLTSAMSADLQADVYAAALLKNDGTPGAVLKLEDDLGADAMKLLRDSWDDRHKGAHQRGKTAVLPPRVTLANAPAQTSKDMGLTSQRERLIQATKALFGVTDFELGEIADYNRANAEAARAWLWTNTILPTMERIEQSLWTHVFRYIDGGKAWAKFDVSKVSALAPVLSDKATTAATLINVGFDPMQVSEKLGLGLDYVALPDVAPTVEGDAPKPDAPVDPSGVGLNGAQVTAVLAVLAAVSAGTLKPEAAVITLATAFPMIPEATARRMVAGAIVAPPQEPAPPVAAKSFGIIVKDGRPSPLSRATAMRLQRAWRQHAELVVGKKWRSFTGERYAQTIAAARSMNDLGALSASQVDALLHPVSEWRNGAERAATAAFKGLGKPLADNLGAEIGGFNRIEVGQATFAPAAGRRVAQMVKVGEHLRTRIRSAIVKDLQDGTVADLEKILQARFKGLLPSNAAVVARTEAGMFQNDVRNSLMVADGIDEKEWSAANDQWTRDSHRELNGTRIAVTERFANGLLYPCESGGPASEVIQCRCSALPYMRERE